MDIFIYPKVTTSNTWHCTTQRGWYLQLNLFFFCHLFSEGICEDFIDGSLLVSIQLVL